MLRLVTRVRRVSSVRPLASRLAFRPVDARGGDGTLLSGHSLQRSHAVIYGARHLSTTLKTRKDGSEVDIQPPPPRRASSDPSASTSTSSTGKDAHTSRNKPQGDLPTHWKYHPPHVELKNLCRYLWNGTTHEAMIVTGPNGVGKSLLVDKALREVESGKYKPVKIESEFEQEDDSELNRIPINVCPIRLDVAQYGSYQTFQSAFMEKATMAALTHPRLSSSDVLSLLKGPNKDGLLYELLSYSGLENASDEPSESHVWESIVGSRKDAMAKKDNADEDARNDEDNDGYVALQVALEVLSQRERRWEERRSVHGDTSKRRRGVFQLELIMRMLKTLSDKGVDCKIALHNFHLLRQFEDASAIQFHDALLLPFKFAKKGSPCSIPLVLEVEDPYYAHHLNDDFFTLNFKFTEVMFWRESEILRYFGSLMTRPQCRVIFDHLGGHPDHIRHFLAAWSKSPRMETLEETLGTFILTHVKEDFDDKMDAMFASDALQPYAHLCHPELFHVCSYLDRIGEAKYVLNYVGGWGEEFVELPLTQAMLQANLLYQQRSRYYIRAQSRAFERLMALYSLHHRLHMSPWASIRYRLYHRFRGTVPLKHLHRSDQPYAGPSQGKFTYTPS